MSNILTFQYTIFKSVYPTGEPMDEGHGYRIYDDYGVEYRNTFESIDELNEEFYIDGEPDIPTIFNEIKSFDRFKDIEEDVISAIDINGTVYDWEKIKELFPNFTP